MTITGGVTYSETLYLNAWGEVVRRVDGEGNERRYEYGGDGKLAKAFDGYNNETGYEWNEIGKVIIKGNQTHRELPLNINLESLGVK